MEHVSQTMGKDENKAALLPPYLHNNSWEEELNFKLWVTKGSRFCANERLLKHHTLSNQATAFLSAYIIIASLIPVFLPELREKVSPNSLGLIISGISIMLLVYTQSLGSRDYKLKAHKHHECALKISNIYNRLRQAKEVVEPDKKKATIEDITRKYEAILDLYENHQPIGYATFQIQKPDYFKLTKWSVGLRHLRHFTSTYFWYILLIAAPPVVMWGFIFPH